MAAALVCLAVLAAPAWAGSDPRPNIVFISSDDQTLASLQEGAMPRTERLIGKRGASFSEMMVTSPLCCPSRASWITGQYAHNHHVLENFPGYGALTRPGNVLPVWMRRAGYTTIHIGKWLNKYGGAVGDPNKVAPGWREWHSIISDSDTNLRYYAYSLKENGEAHKFGHKDSDHLSRVITDRSLQMLREYLPKPKPIYMQVDHLAPHTSPDPRLPCRRAAKPDPRDVGLFDDRVLPQPPSFNEEDVSDKNTAVSHREQFTEEQVADMTRKYRCALASLVAVDRNVDRIVKTLRRFGELGNTVLIFTSDNGYYHAEHRLTQKGLPYEEGVRVPLMVRLPASLRDGAPEGMVIDEPVAGIDIAPTLLDIADGVPCRGSRCRTLDGRSLLPLLQDDTSDWPADRALAVELRRAAPGDPTPKSLNCAYQGFRTPEVAYFEFWNGVATDLPCPEETGLFDQVESYDLLSDPYQLDSDGPNGSFANRLDHLRDCAGIQGRDPLPPSGHWCE